MAQKGFGLGRWACWVIIIFSLYSGVSLAVAQTPVSWLPVSKEELELKDNPLAPGEPAIILYRELQTDSAKSHQTVYTRIKILKENGKDYANVEIPYSQEIEVGQVQARTVAPDGKSTEFSGTIFDRAVVKSKRFKVTVKSFSLPDVQVGSIIEYSYGIHWRKGVPDEFKNPGKYVFDGAYVWPAAVWEVQQDVFARRTHFVLRPYSKGTRLEIQSIAVPEKFGKPQTLADGSIQWDLDNVPAFHQEDHAPPEDAIKGRVQIYYVGGAFFSPSSYWSTHGRWQASNYEKFFSKSKAIQAEAAKLVAGADTPEAKLRKLYDRAQQLRFLSYERSRTEKEQKQENLTPNKTAEEVLTRGYAYANESNLFFVALAREAGFSANPVMVTSRKNSLFLENIFDSSQLDAMVVEVRAGNKTYYLDPATLHCPFGMLPWEEEDTQGVRLDRYNASLVSIPAGRSSDAVIERRSSLKMDSDRNLKGKLDVAFRGQEALSRRGVAAFQDEAGRRKGLEEEVKAWLPQGATATLSSVTGWDGSETPLQASFDVQIPGFGSQAGGRLLLPAILFHTGWEKSFQSPQREHPIYLEYGHQEADDVTLELPGDLKVEQVPSMQGFRDKFASFRFSTELQGTQLKMTRQVSMDGYYFPVAFYPRLRNFYDLLRANDEEMTVLKAAPAAK